MDTATIDLNEASANSWTEYIKPFKGSLTEFFNVLVPCSSNCKAPQNSRKKRGRQFAGTFAKYCPVVGHEKTDVPLLISGMKRLVSDFADREPTFLKTGNQPLSFPDHMGGWKHHKVTPAILLSFPGQRLERKTVTQSQWHDISTVIEVKANADEDPFLILDEWKDTEHKPTTTPMEMIRCARTLLDVHGDLAAFTVGVYGEYARIVRFDRSGAIVSKRFSIKQNPNHLRRFFWHFTHPKVGDTVVGCDPTISPLRSADKRWVKTCLRQLGEDLTDFDKYITHGRRVLLYDDVTGASSWYIAYRALSHRAAPFSVGSSIWCALKDTRVPDSADYVLPKTQVLKDAWPQLYSHSELQVYRRLANNIPEGQYRGLAKLVTGGDLGRMEVREWARTTPHAESHVTGKNKWRLECTLNEGSASKSSNPTASSSDSQAGPASPPNLFSSEDPYPLPFPQHQTFSRALTEGNISSERTHIRFVIDDFGREIEKFKNTREMVTAFRDAIIGHQVAWNKANVLQRDVSMGNIMIYDREDGSAPAGFLHDFDHCITREQLAANYNLALSVEQRKEAERRAKLASGTRPFLAIQRHYSRPVPHRPQHDLESFYWVLLYVLLRYCPDPRGRRICRFTIYDTPGPDFSYSRAMTAKKLWLEKWFDEEEETYGGLMTALWKNEPLNVLHKEFHELVKVNYDSGGIKNLDHTTIIKLFNKALDSPGWPEDDAIYHVHKKIPAKPVVKCAKREDAVQPRQYELRSKKQPLQPNGGGRVLRKRKNDVLEDIVNVKHPQPKRRKKDTP